MQHAETTTIGTPIENRRDRLCVAACVRLLHMEGLLTYNGHVSARVPGRDHFLIHALIDSRSEVVPERLLTVDFDGRVVDKPPDCRPPSEYPIHAEIYRARDDVAAVAHIHSEHAIAFTLVDDVPLRALRCDALDWADGVPVHADPSRIKTAEQGRALAATLGTGSAALMRAHGAVLAAPSVIELFKACVQFEENARAQLLAMRLGTLKPLTPSELDTLRESHPPEFRAHYASKIWRYYVAQGRAAGVIPVDWVEELLCNDP